MEGWKPKNQDQIEEIKRGQEYLFDAVADLQDMPVMRAKEKITRIFGSGVLTSALSEQRQNELHEACRLIRDLPEVKALDKAIDLIMEAAAAFDESLK